MKSSGGFKCVVKPNESAGTDSVFLCNTPEEVLTAFTAIHNHSNGLGHTNDGALCQEFLSGTEFVIDGVSRDGVYKVCTCQNETFYTSIYNTCSQTSCCCVLKLLRWQNKMVPFQYGAHTEKKPFYSAPF